MHGKLNFKVCLGMAILLCILLVAVFAPVLSPHDPYELGVPYLRPSAEHPLGTNDIGQDILSELIYGTRISLLIGVVSALAVTVIGTALGVTAGSILPARVVSALSVALFGMFLAIIIPPSKKNPVVLGCVCVSFAASWLCSVLPLTSALSEGTRTILLTILIASAAAALFPVKDEPEEKEAAGHEH